MAGLAEHLGVEEEPEHEEPEKDGEEEGDGDHFEQMAETMMEAIREDDHEAFAKTLKAFFKRMETEPHEEAAHVKSPMDGLLGLSEHEE